MKYLPRNILLAALVQLASAHGGHEHGSGPAAGETIQQYAQRHMSSEHHIDSFDIRSFFQLHDLNRDGVWDREEIEAVYGVHHDEIEHQKKADEIVNTVLFKIDQNRDGVITPDELETVGLDGLPNFDGLGAEGHHYDVESEFFLHHEEMYHSTPETQTDESYNHPEDLEHFAQHDAIEHQEAEREAKFQGITVEEAIKQHEEHEHNEGTPAPGDDAHPGDAQQHLFDEHPHADPPVNPADAPTPKYTRVPPPEKQDPSVRFKDAKTRGEMQGEWGQGPDGYAPPKDAAGKLRRNVPYKYKFRRNWGDF
ncbi:hypothetical protein ONZ45_g7153 [Pleurotus djamor]|nr:hypothetical protein ONZ45_g7153 [Pleurotus djamor]